MDIAEIYQLQKLYQSEKVVITSLNENVREMYKDILLCILDRDYVNKTELSAIELERQEKWLKDEQIYLGIQVMNKITQPELRCQSTANKEFFQRCRHFLITSAKEIKKRYNLDDPILSKLDCLEPTNAASSNYRKKVPTLQPLMILVPRIIKPEDMQVMQAIDDEWRSFPNISDKIDVLSMNTDEFWGVIKNNLKIIKHWLNLH